MVGKSVGSFKMHRSESSVGVQLTLHGDRTFTEGVIRTMKVVYSLELFQRILILCPESHVFDCLQFRGHEMQISYRRVNA